MPSGPGQHPGPVIPGFGNPPNLGVGRGAGIPIIGNPPAGSGSGGGNDWQHLMIRGAEFIVGALLVVVGVNAIIARSKAGQTIIQTTGTVAKVAAK